MAGRYAGTGAAPEQLDIPGLVYTLAPELAAVHPPTSNSSDCQRESPHHLAGATACYGNCLRILFLALAAGMEQPGPGDSGIARAGVGMDALLYFNLAHGPSRGRRAAGKTTRQGLKPITPFVALASITPILATTPVKLLRN